MNPQLRRSDIFRPQALAAVAGERRPIVALSLSSAWSSWTYWILLSLAAAAFAYACFGSVAVYVPGQAVMVVDGRVELKTRQAGHIGELLVQPGAVVVAGAAIARMHRDDADADEIEGRRELEDELALRLSEGAGQNGPGPLRSLARQEGARRRASSLTIRSPISGVLTNLRVQTGEFLQIGEVLGTVTPAEAKCAVVATLPGRYLPDVRVGMRARFHPQGAGGFGIPGVLTEVAPQNVGPKEALRTFGVAMGDAFELKGAVTVVKARLGSCDLHDGATELTLHEGMIGLVDLHVRDESAFRFLFPRYRALAGADDGS